MPIPEDKVSSNNYTNVTFINKNSRKVVPVNVTNAFIDAAMDPYKYLMANTINICETPASNIDPGARKDNNSFYPNKNENYLLNSYGFKVGSQFNYKKNMDKDDYKYIEIILDPDIKGYPLSFFSDQIFLNDWPTLFKNSFKEIENIGVNVAPWNALNYSFKFRNDKYFVNEEQLLIYHFSSLIKIDNQRWNVNSGLTFFSLNKVLSIIYKNYINHLESFDLEITK